MSRSFVSMALRTGLPFGVVMGIYNGVRSGPGAGVASGVVMGAAFGVAMAGFVHWQSKKFAAMRADFEPEGLVHDGPANRGGTGGWLFLTKRRLVFVPHKVNISTARVDIPVADITSVAGSARKLDVISPGGSHSFTVSPQDGWQKRLKP